MSAWLKEKGEQISQPALSAHKRAHLDVVADAKTVLEARASVLGQDGRAVEQARADGIQKVVADVSLLDELAGYAMSAIQRLAPEMGDPSMAQAAAFGSALKECRELVKQRDEILTSAGKRQPVTAEQRPSVTIIYADNVSPTDGDPPQSAAEPRAPATTSR